MKTAICEYCGKDVEYHTEMVVETVKLYGKSYTFVGKKDICNECNHNVQMSKETENFNDMQLLKEYNAKKENNKSKFLSYYTISYDDNSNHHITDQDTDIVFLLTNKFFLESISKKENWINLYTAICDKAKNYDHSPYFTFTYNDFTITKVQITNDYKKVMDKEEYYKAIYS